MKLSDGSFADVSSVGASHADNAGRYSIDGLPDGSYIVLGAMEGPLVPVFGGDQLGASGWIAFAGGGMRPSKARVIGVKAPNEYTGVDLTLPLVGVHEVSGTVVAPGGHRLNHAAVRLYPTGEACFSSVTPLQADVTFSFHRIPPDTYTLAVEDASDLVLVPKNGGGFTYQERAVAQRYRSTSTTINIRDADATDVTLTTTPIR